MKTTYSWKRITDQQIADAFNGWPTESPLARLMNATGYPYRKCALALHHAIRRGLIEQSVTGLVVMPHRIRTSTSAKR